MGRFTIAVLGGDGIGPEVTAEASAVLRAVAARFGHTFELHEALAGQAAIEAEGEAISDETMRLCQRSDAVLFGAVGGAGVGRPD
ncbi:MAG TPA: isocitrate/isopropylmalate family dehydrogenase, partial [Ktedonobacterales bacterium]|nr:isocitrate/isopropylmalate family dehydrogenase [Ktedonobacterales bacterium]